MTMLMFLAGLTLQTPVSAAIPTRAPASDTTVVVQGLLVKSSGWIIALPTPLVHGQRVIRELELAGDTLVWKPYNGFYVEARGTLAGTELTGPRRRGALTVETVREVDPPGTARRIVSNSWAHRVGITLWVLPQKFKWRNASGQPSGAGPVIVYTFNNHSESDVTMTFETKDFICFVVEPEQGGSPPWRFTRQLQQPEDRLKVTLPKFIREVVPIPESGAPLPGRYSVRAGLCDFKEYELETQIEIQR